MTIYDSHEKPLYPFRVFNGPFRSFNFPKVQGKCLVPTSRANLLFTMPYLIEPPPFKDHLGSGPDMCLAYFRL